MYSWFLLLSWSVEIVEWAPVKWLVGILICQRDTEGVVGTQCAAEYFVRSAIFTRLTSVLYVMLYEATKRKKTTDYTRVLLHEIKMTVACDLVYLVIDMLFWS